MRLRSKENEGERGEGGPSKVGGINGKWRVDVFPL